MSDKNIESTLPEDEERLRQFLVSALAPDDPATASDAELKEFLDGLGDEPFPDDRLESLLKKVEVQLHEASPGPPPVVTAPDEASDLVPGDAAAGPPSSSPVLGFLGNLSHFGGSFTPTLWTLLVLVSGMVLTLALVLLAIHGIRVQVEVAGGGEQGAASTEEKAGEEGDAKAREVPSPRLAVAVSPLLPSAVAKLTRMADCRWDDQELMTGARLRTGQSLHLVSGVAEVNFDVGVRVILQGPASLELLSADSARLNMGKLTAEITNKAARGFKIQTPEATFVDQGTEFGVEVTRGGSSRVHVFQGEVDVALDPKVQSAVQPERLTADYGARLEGSPSSMTLLKDTGESFIRTIEQAGRDRHTVAWWRFEDQPLRVILPNTLRNSKTTRATVDSSYNGNDLFTFSSLGGPQFSGDVAADVVPRTGVANQGCLNNTVPPEEGVPTRNVYSHSQFSHAAPLDLQQITPAEWTIEISVRPKCLHAGPQTFICRDAKRGQQPRLAFQITDQDRFAIAFVDVKNRLRRAIAAALEIKEMQWYHLAAVSDGRTLKLYADCQDGRGYELQASVELPKTGPTALGKSSDSREWAVGRSRNKSTNQTSEWFQGWIDEVRISDIAREPSEFLFVAPNGKKR